MKRIKLDATCKSTLKWNVEPTDEKIIWHLDLGLENLSKPFNDMQQCAALKLAVDHFVKTLYSNFKTEKCLMYQGALPINEFHTRNLLSDYLDIITANVPKSLVMELDFTQDPSLHPIINAQLFNKEAFSRFSLVKKPQKTSKTAIALPPKEIEDLNALIKRADLEESYQILAETELLDAFGDLDQIIYDPKSISREGMRILHGFSAADGTIVAC